MQTINANSINYVILYIYSKQISKRISTIQYIIRENKKIQIISYSRIRATMYAQKYLSN